MNRCDFIGRLTNDPVKGQTGPVRFSLAVTKNTKGKDGTWQSDVQFFNMIAWGNVAERIVALKKGDTVHVECEANNNEYTDKNGNQQRVVQFVVRSFYQVLVQKQAKSSEPKVEKEEDFPF